MDGFIAWCGFCGAWLLLAGPIYQAALELQEQDFQRDEIQAASTSVSGPPPVSPWWWLFPPALYLKRRRRTRIIRRTMMQALTPEQLSGLVEYINKATGWLLVGAGGLLIATKETWELREHYEWPLFVFFALAVVMPLLAALYVAVRLQFTRHVLAGATEG